MEKTKRSTFKLLFYLKKNAPKKNGMVAIMARITVDGKIAQFSTKLEVKPGNWDLKFGRVPGKRDKAKSINQKLDKIRLLIDRHYYDMINDEGFVTARKLKNVFLGIGVEDDSLLKVFKKHNEDFKKMVDNGTRGQSTYYKYDVVYNHLSGFIKEKHFKEDMTFRELTPDFIRDFDFFLRVDKKCTHNTIWVYMMPLCRMVELALKKGLIRRNPFEDYEISKEEEDRVYLLKEDVEKIMLYKVGNSTSEIVKDLFIFSCFTGFSYIDIKKMKRSNIQSFFDGHQWIISRRKKTDIASNVRLLNIPKKIIEKYDGITQNDYLFPIPSNATCNAHIRKVTEKAGIIKEKKISFHTARHTFGTMFLTEGVALESLSKMMGHKNITTTQLYAKITNEKISRDMDILSQRLQATESSLIEAI